MKPTVKPTVRVRKMTFKSGSFDPRTGVLHIETHSGSSTDIRTGVLGGSDNLMWQYEKKENEYLIPFLGTLLIFLVFVGVWIKKIQTGLQPQNGIQAITRQDVHFVLGLAISLYVVSAHIMFAIPGFNGVTVAMIAFFAFFADFLLADSKFCNHLQMNFCNVLILLSIYMYTALYCDIFDAKKDNGKFDMGNGVFGVLCGLVFAVALFYRFAFPRACAKSSEIVEGKIVTTFSTMEINDERIIINIDYLFQGIVFCISSFFFFEAWAVATCEKLLYSLSFLFLFLAVLLSGIRMVMKRYTNRNTNIFNMIWILAVTTALIMTVLHITGLPNAWASRLSPVFDKDNMGFKIGILSMWAFVILIPAATTYSLTTAKKTSGSGMFRPL